MAPTFHGIKGPVYQQNKSVSYKASSFLVHEIQEPFVNKRLSSVLETFFDDYDTNNFMKVC